MEMSTLLRVGLLLGAVLCCSGKMMPQGDAVDLALEAVRKVLGKNKHPVFAGDVLHTYEDKFGLVENVGSVAAGTLVQALQAWGMSVEEILDVHKVSESELVQLEYQESRRCRFKEKTSKEVPDKRPTEYLIRLSTTVEEWHWDFEAAVTLSLRTGKGRLLKTLTKVTPRIMYKTMSKDAPYPEEQHFDPIVAPVDWLFELVGQGLQKGASGIRLHVERGAKGCFTPRRNAEIERIYVEMQQLAKWGSRVRNSVWSVFDVQQAVRRGADEGEETHKSVSASVADEHPFVPVVPFLLKDGKKGKLADSETSADLLRHHAEDLQAHLDKVADVLPARGLITAGMGQVALWAVHVGEVSRAFTSGVDNVEEMLRIQLVKAIGEEVTERQFNEFMARHNRKLFRKEVSPKPLSVSVRRAERAAPEGTFGVYRQGSSRKLVEALKGDLGPATYSMDLDAANTVTLNVSNEVAFGWTSYVFGGEPEAVDLVARAKQFSSYVLVLCKRGEGDSLLPLDAVVLSNADELEVRLLLKMIPAPKEFEDHVSSLSPNQRRFAQAYRQAQLAGSLLSVVVVQVKPHLERLLNLPREALTKETRLTHDILELFMKHDISADLLSYDAAMDGVGLVARETVDTVRGHVGVMLKMIDDITGDTLKQAKEKREYEKGREVDEEVVLEDDGGAMHGAYAMHGVMRHKGGQHRHRDIMMASMAAPPTGASGTPPATPPSPPTSGAPQEGGREVTSSKLAFVFEEMLREHDEHRYVRPTIVEVGDHWQRTTKADILAAKVTSSVDGDKRRKLKDEAFGLLDALTKSGTLPLDCEVYTLFTATHQFDSTLLRTIIEGDRNPIEHTERSTVLLAMALSGAEAPDLVDPSMHDQVKGFTPELFANKTEKVRVVAQK